MADYLSFQIKARGNTAKAISGLALQEEFRIETQELVDVCRRAATPGLSALRSNAQAVHRVTGRLASAPAILTKYYRRKRTGVVAAAIVGYASGVAPHATLVEKGTKQRASRRGNRGAMRGQFPLMRAFDSSRATMEASLSEGLARLMAQKAQSVGR